MSCDEQAKEIAQTLLQCSADHLAHVASILHQALQVKMQHQELQIARLQRTIDEIREAFNSPDDDQAVCLMVTEILGREE
jgi:hypothetical protein